MSDIAIAAEQLRPYVVKEIEGLSTLFSLKLWDFAGVDSGSELLKEVAAPFEGLTVEECIMSSLKDEESSEDWEDFILEIDPLRAARLEGLMSLMMAAVVAASEAQDAGTAGMVVLSRKAMH